MNKNRTLLLTLILGIVGILFFMYQRNWIILQFTFWPTWQAASHANVAKDATYHKEVRLYYWKENKWVHDAVTIVWNDQNQAQNLRQVLKQWLVLLHDEHILPFPVTVESVALSSMGGDAFVSFSRPLFTKDWSVADKWLVLNALFKTIRYAMPSVQMISLQVHQKPMEDDHLEFTYPLPVEER